jgi:hypothetical protein
VGVGVGVGAAQAIGSTRMDKTASSPAR